MEWITLLCAYYSLCNRLVIVIVIDTYYICNCLDIYAPNLQLLCSFTALLLFLFSFLEGKKSIHLNIHFLSAEALVFKTLGQSHLFSTLSWWIGMGSIVCSPRLLNIKSGWGSLCCIVYSTDSHIVSCEWVSCAKHLQQEYINGF